MIVLGIDPGSRKTGYAVIETRRSGEEILAYGTVKLTDLSNIPDKLVRIFGRIGALLDEFRISTVAVEAGYYGKNAQSAYKLGYARSAVVLAAALKQIAVVEYSPRKVKQAVTGNGNASKSQVKYMVRNLLHLDGEVPISEDEADACAIAICHVQNSDRSGRTYRSWKEFVDKNKRRIVRRSAGGRVR